MKRKRGLFRKIYFIMILMMLSTTALAGMQVMASTDDQESQENKVHWKSNTKDEEIEIPEGVTGDGGKWESPTYTSSDDETNNTSIETKPMSAGAEYAAIMAGLIGVLAISAAKKSSNESVSTVSEGNGIWVPESDRDTVIKMVNKAASKEYYIDANGFVKEVIGAVEDTSKSSTYSSVLDRLIKGDNKVVIGVGDGWVSSGENGLEANAFTGDNSGITIGDNGTPQVVVVSGEDMPNSSADITLAHELIHALRGEDGIKSINTTDGINKDEEAHTIELENNIREELGYVARTDGDSSDCGDGSYGKYSDSSEEDWYNKIDEMQGSDTLSGNAYSLYEQSDYQSPSNPTGISQSYGPSNPSAPIPNRAPTTTKIASELSDCDEDCDCDCDCDCQWGSSYDDSIWSKGGSFSVVNNVLSGVSSWGIFGVPKRNWGTFFRSNTDTKKTLGGITSAVSNAVIYNKDFNYNYNIGFKNYYNPRSTANLFNLSYIYTPETIIMGQGYMPKDIYLTGWKKGNEGEWYYYSSGVRKTGWMYNSDNWYYLDKSGVMQTGWKQDNGKWYYLDESGAMLANTTVEGYYLGDSGAWIPTQDEVDDITDEETSEEEEIDETDNELLEYQQDIEDLKNSDNILDGAKYFGKYLWDRWPGLWGQINEQNALNMGMDPEWAKLAGDYSSALFLEGFTTITVNGVRAYKNITTGEIIYEDSFVAGSGIGNTVKGSADSSIKNIYDSIKKAPQYPEGFEGVANGIRKVNIKNGGVLDELRKVESGQWKKVYKDGYDASGKEISIHYFQSESGKVFNVKVKAGWSNIV